jgi:hypothetical protein
MNSGVMPRTNNNGVIPEKWLKPSSNSLTSRFEVKPTCPFGQGISNDIIISKLQSAEERGSPSLVRIPPMILPDSIMREEEEIERRSGGPKEIRTPDPRHVKAVS